MWKSTIIGNLGGDAEKKEFGQDHTPYLVMRVAVNLKRGGQETTEWFTAYWRYTENKETVAKYLTKGTTVYIEGNPNDNIYLSGSDKKPAIGHAINVTSLELCGRSSNQQSNGGYDPITNTYASQRTATATSAATSPSTTVPAASPADSISPADDLPF